MTSNILLIIVTTLLTTHVVSATLYQTVVAGHLSPTYTSKYERLTFDDLSLSNITNSSLSFLHKPYHNLNFTSFALFNSSSPRTSPPTIDLDCAFSGTNALVASRRPNEAWPRFQLDAELAIKAGIAPFFNLHGLAQKPIGRVQAGTRLWVHALGVVDHCANCTGNSVLAGSDHPPHSVPIHRNSSRNDWASDRYEIISSYTLVTVVQADGYTDNFYLNMSGLFPGFGEMVNMVEVYAEVPTGEDEEGLYTGFEDWMFCIDDLVVEWINGDEVGMQGVQGARGEKADMSRIAVQQQDGDCDASVAPKTRFMQVQVNL